MQFGSGEVDCVARRKIGRFRYGDPVGLGNALDPAGDIHRVAPIVICIAAAADHAAHHRAGVDADAHPHVEPGLRRKTADGTDDLAAEMDRLARAAIARGLPSRNREIGIADGLDLLHPAAIGAAVGDREHLVEDLDQHAGGKPPRELREPDDVDEHHRHVGEGIGRRLPLAQPLRNRGGQHVEQQVFGLLALDIERALRGEGLARAAFALDIGTLDCWILETPRHASPPLPLREAT